MTSVLRFYETHLYGGGNGDPVVGDTKTSITLSDHNGWLLCDGRLITAKAFPFLFKAIGYTFGGSAGTFRLPDGRGRVIGNVNTATVGGPLDMNGNPIAQHAFGTVTGEETHTLTIPEMPTHNHGGTTGTSTTGITLNNATTFSSSNDNNSLLPGVGDSANSGGFSNTVTLTDPGHSHTITNQGSSIAHNNMQPTLYMGNMFIYTGMIDKNTSSPFIFN
jgi:microcystin-dependent protein